MRGYEGIISVKNQTLIVCILSLILVSFSTVEIVMLLTTKHQQRHNPLPFKQPLISNPKQTIQPTIRWVNKNIDSLWLNSLRYEPIQSVEPAIEYFSGLSFKFQANLTNNQRVMLKLTRPWSPVPLEWMKISFDALSEDFKKSFKRADRKYQAWPEIVSVAVDRVLGFHRKVPTTGRLVNSTTIYPSDLSFFGLITRFGSFLGLIDPYYQLEMSATAWYENLRVISPPASIGDFLKLQSPVPGDTENMGASIQLAGDISDCIIFDFLVDDHDRYDDRNWLGDKLSMRLVNWDSGLAFQHGPDGGHSCLEELFKGPKAWEGEHHSKLICRFRKSTYTRLKQLQSKSIDRNFANLNSTEETFGSLVEQFVKEDPLYPIFDQSLYYSNFRYPKFRIDSKYFFKGLDIKLNRLIDHIENCVEKFGSASVFFQ